MLCSCDCCASEDEGDVKDDGFKGEDVDSVVSKTETYSSIQLIKIPLSKKPVKFRSVHFIL